MATGERIRKLRWRHSPRGGIAPLELLSSNVRVWTTTTSFRHFLPACEFGQKASRPVGASLPRQLTAPPRERQSGVVLGAERVPSGLCHRMCHRFRVFCR